jgi:hypothetical protein
MRPTAHERPIISARRTYRWKFVRFVVALPISDVMFLIRHALQQKKITFSTMMTKSGTTVKIRIAVPLMM